ncbi:hypothetical protein C5S35_02850, partial [Candidatus Methanophagaceae archaeon]
KGDMIGLLPEDQVVNFNCIYTCIYNIKPNRKKAGKKFK